MTNEKTNGTSASSGMGFFSRLFRFIVFFATAGFVYPNVFVENIDVTRHHASFQKKPTSA